MDTTYGQRMPAHRLQSVCDGLGLGDAWLSRVLGVRRDTCFRWRAGKDPIPYRVPGEIATALRLMAERAAMEADALDADFAAGP